MSKIIDDMKREATRQTSIQIAINLLTAKMCSLEETAKVTGLTLEEVKELSASLNTPQ